MYSIILKNGMAVNVDADLEWTSDSRIIRLTKDNIVVGVFNADNIAGLVNTDYEVQAEVTYITESDEPKTESEKDGIAVIFAGCQEMLSNLDLSMSYVLEGDHRSFTNQETENGWLFDKIIDWRKMIQPYIKEED